MIIKRYKACFKAKLSFFLFLNVWSSVLKACPLRVGPHLKRLPLLSGLLLKLAPTFDQVIQLVPTSRYTPEAPPTFQSTHTACPYFPVNSWSLFRTFQSTHTTFRYTPEDSSSHFSVCSLKIFSTFRSTHAGCPYFAVHSWSCPLLKLSCFRTFGVLAPTTYEVCGFIIFWHWSYLMNVIPELRTKLDIYVFISLEKVKN